MLEIHIAHLKQALPHQLHIEKLAEGVYLATCNDVLGLAQGRAIQETIEIARDVAKKSIESQAATNLPTASESLDLPLIVAT